LPVILHALERSEFFVLFASPEAARSEGVAREAELWLERKGTDNLVIILMGGRLAWDERVRDFDWEKTSALPDAFRYKFSREPLWLDARGLSEEQLSLDHPEFQDLVATVAAAIRGRSKEELLAEQIRQSRRAERARLLLVGVIGALSSFFASFMVGDLDKLSQALSSLIKKLW
jgi:hypothetical protein